VLPQETAHDLTDMMRAVIDQGTARAIRWQLGSRIDVAGKTGTTQNNTDGWFILMHPRLVTGSWVGFNDARIAMRSNYWGQGAHAALPIVGDFARRSMNAKLIDATVRFPEPPEPFYKAIWNKLLGLFGWSKVKQEPAPVLPKRLAPSAPPVEEAPEPRKNEMERILTQAVEAAPLVDAAKDAEQAAPKPAEEAPRAIGPAGAESTGIAVPQMP
jgi:penicillin-binding protein 1A